jgi:hypothetical protein
MLGVSAEAINSPQICHAPWRSQKAGIGTRYAFCAPIFCLWRLFERQRQESLAPGGDRILVVSASSTYCSVTTTRPLSKRASTLGRNASSLVMTARMGRRSNQEESYDRRTSCTSLSCDTYLLV